MFGDSLCLRDLSLEGLREDGLERLPLRSELARLLELGRVLDELFFLAEDFFISTGFCGLILFVCSSGPTGRPNVVVIRVPGRDLGEWSFRSA